MWEAKHPNKAIGTFSRCIILLLHWLPQLHGNSTTSSFCYIHTSGGYGVGTAEFTITSTPPSDKPPAFTEADTPRPPTTTKNNQSSRLSHIRTDALLPPPPKFFRKPIAAFPLWWETERREGSRSVRRRQSKEKEEEGKETPICLQWTCF